MRFLIKWDFELYGFPLGFLRPGSTVKLLCFCPGSTVKLYSSVPGTLAKKPWSKNLANNRDKNLAKNPGTPAMY